MIKAIKYFLDRLVRSDALYHCMDRSVFRVVDFLKARREAWNLERGLGGPEWWQNEFAEQQLQLVFEDGRVRHGPFAGMQYESLQSTGSTLFPKLLGSYEREIQNAIEEFCRQQYDVIIDVGCAEGYYAVGIARRIPAARVHAFDTNPRALELCRLMAEANDVAQRLTLHSECTSNMLQALANTDRALILCDCEGAELEIFDTATAKALSNHDLIIELHDGTNPALSLTLTEIFGQTHDIERISSVDDIRKGQSYEYDELATYSLEERVQLLAERRTYVMEWLVCRGRH